MWLRDVWLNYIYNIEHLWLFDWIGASSVPIVFQPVTVTGTDRTERPVSSWVDSVIVAWPLMVWAVASVRRDSTTTPCVKVSCVNCGFTVNHIRSNYISCHQILKNLFFVLCEVVFLLKIYSLHIDLFWLFDWFVECNCNPAGAKEIPGYPLGGCGEVIKGQLCECKERVMGRICDQCMPGYFKLDRNNPLGCEGRTHPLPYLSLLEYESQIHENVNLP